MADLKEAKITEYDEAEPSSYREVSYNSQSNDQNEILDSSCLYWWQQLNSRSYNS